MEYSFTTPHCRNGWAFLPVLILITVLSTVTLTWYQSEIQYRLQTQASSRFHGLYHELHNAIEQSLFVLKDYSRSELQPESLSFDPSLFDYPMEAWSIELLETLPSSHLRLQFEKNTPPIPQAFEVLFYLEPYSITQIPWIQPQLEGATLPITNLHLASQQEEIRVREAPYLFLQPELTFETADLILGANAIIDWSSNEIREGSTVVGRLDGESPLVIQATERLILRGDLSQAKRPYLLIQAEKDVIAELASTAPEFGAEASHFFIHSQGSLELRAQSALGSIHSNVYGHVLIEGESCVQLDATSLLSVYWQGSIACQSASPAVLEVPLYLKHQEPTVAAPDAFQYERIHLNAVRLITD